MDNPFSNVRKNAVEDSSVSKTGTPKLPNKMPITNSQFEQLLLADSCVLGKSPKKKFQELDPDEVNPPIDKKRNSKKVAFASSSKIIESGSGSHRRSSNKSYVSDN